MIWPPSFLFHCMVDRPVVENAMYVAQYFNYSPNSPIADDAKIFRSIRSVNDNGVLQNDLDKLSEWSERWQLPFNTGKCKSLHIGKKNKHRIYEMNGQQLDQVKEEKDLGVLIDDELKFHKQTAAAIKTANRVLGVVKKSYSYFDDRNLPLIYKSLIRPHLEYGNIVWGPFYKEDKIAIKRVQRRATKLVPRIKHYTYEERLRELHLPSLLHRRRRGDMMFAYKLVTGRLNINKDDFSFSEYHI